MRNPVIIQGGMGIGVSNWKLAKTVSKLGHLGVVSGTAINTVLVRKLQDGDPEGDVRRALSHFPDKAVAEKILNSYFISGGRAKGQPYKLSPVPVVNPSNLLQQLMAAGAFVEVYLAKEGHDGLVGVNFLEKLHTSCIAGIYGAMLAGVDYVLMGAGIPREIPGVLDRFALHQEASVKVSMYGTSPEPVAEVRISCNPSLVFPDLKLPPLKRPEFLAIITSATLASHLFKKSTGKVNGFVIENPTAGGHNAPPRGPLRLGETGEPIYGIKDVTDVAAIREIGLPFWIAGSYGARGKLRLAQDQGAVGIQVGTAFAFCEESGLEPEIKKAVIQKYGLKSLGTPEPVKTDPLASPTDFPFKVAPMAGTVSDQSVYLARPRKCDLGYLRQPTFGPEGKIIYRCSSEPVEDYLRKGGKIEDTVGRKCLCNALMANIGQGQIQAGNREELALLTAGDDLIHLSQFLSPGRESYGAEEVIRHLMS